MTAERAAKACMAKIAKCLDEFYHEESRGWAEIEREFTEIISQVTPPLPAPLLQGMLWERSHASQSTARGMAESHQCSTDMNSGFDIERFPQEIEEPRPKPWWKIWSK